MCREETSSTYVLGLVRGHCVQRNRYVEALEDDWVLSTAG